MPTSASPLQQALLLKLLANQNPKDGSGILPLQSQPNAPKYPNGGDFPLRSVEWDPLNDPMNEVKFHPDPNFINGGTWGIVTPEEREQVKSIMAYGKPPYSVSQAGDIELPNTVGQIDPRIKLIIESLSKGNK